TGVFLDREIGGLELEEWNAAAVNGKHEERGLFLTAKYGNGRDQCDGRERYARPSPQNWTHASLLNEATIEADRGVEPGSRQSQAGIVERTRRAAAALEDRAVLIGLSRVRERNLLAPLGKHRGQPAERDQRFELAAAGLDDWCCNEDLSTVLQSIDRLGVGRLGREHHQRYPSAAREECLQ